MRSACPPIMYGCKYLNFSSSKSEMELLSRRTIQELEGDEGQQHLDEYANADTERGQCMLKKICEEFGFDSLGFQSLDGLLEAIGLEPEHRGLHLLLERQGVTASAAAAGLVPCGKSKLFPEGSGFPRHAAASEPTKYI